jgi:dTDP-4-amino-4,6-dideoxygalactose transaminase
MKMFEPTREFQYVKDEIKKAVERVLKYGKYINGPEVAKFESEMCQFLNIKHALGVSSGTDALIMALMACDIGPGDEVITSSYSFVAAAEAIVRVGATPVFVDINEPDTGNFCMDVRLVESKITTKTKAIIPVHLFGNCVDMNPLVDLALEYDVKIIEDAAQAFGSKYRQTYVGTIGHIGCFSFFPTKNLGCAGDGGMVVTDDDDLADKLALIRAHGSKGGYVHERIGGNFRLDTIQAAILSVKLKHTSGNPIVRKLDAEGYTNIFNEWHVFMDRADLPAFDEDEVPNQYVIRLRNPTAREELLRLLTERHIEYRIYYPKILPHQECFRGMSSGSYPAAEFATRTSLAIPLHEHLSKFEQTYVVDNIGNHFRCMKSIGK